MAASSSAAAAAAAAASEFEDSLKGASGDSIVDALDPLQVIGPDAGAQQCRAKNLADSCTVFLSDRRCQESIGAERTAAFATSRTPEQVLAKFEGTPWVDACECYVQCAMSPDCVAFDNFHDVCRLFSTCSSDLGVAAATSGSGVWLLADSAAADNSVVCVDGGFSTLFFDVDLLLLGLALSLAANLALKFLGRGFGAGTAGLDEKSWLATHWSRMLARDAQRWNNPRTFHIAGKFARLQNRLDKVIKPRAAGGIIQSVTERYLPSMLAGRFAGIAARLVRFAVYVPFVVWNWGRSLASVPDLGLVGNLVARRIFSLPDCGAGALSLLSWLFLADVAIGYVLERFVR